MCRLVFFCGFDDALEVRWLLGPSEWGGIQAVLLDVAQQKIFQVFLGALDAVGECLPGENAGKAFDHVHPGGVGSGVVEMHSRMSQELPQCTGSSP